MTLENKIVGNYFCPIKILNDGLSTSNSKKFAKMHIDNPLGSRIKGYPDCKKCKGEGYIKCRSGKHERACKVCLNKYVEHIEKENEKLKAQDFINKNNKNFINNTI